jgi:hypothetical protein
MTDDELNQAIETERELLELEKEEDLWVREGSPVLVVGVRHLERVKSSKRPLVPIYHQTSGLACNHIKLHAIVLKPKPLVLAAMQLIERHWFESNMGCFGTSLEEVLFYRMQLKDLVHPRADCNVTYIDLVEGAYPIDLDMSVIRDLCDDDLPDNLDDLLEFESPFSRSMGSVGRWRCFILAENSD